MSLEDRQVKGGSWDTAQKRSHDRPCDDSEDDGVTFRSTNGVRYVERVKELGTYRESRKISWQKWVMDSERVTGFRPELTSWVRLEVIGPLASIVCVMDCSISIKVDTESPKREGLWTPNPHPSVPPSMKDRQLLFLCLIFLEGFIPMGLESRVREQKECLGYQLSSLPLP